MIPKLTLNTKPINVKRALISVYDKTDIIEFANILKSLDIEILSTGGTYKLLKENGIAVKSVSNYTNFPEIMDGRVKTLNPLVLGGIIGLRNEHEEDAKNHKVKWIDLVICNLYPFSNVISKKECDTALALENIDIGGPTMLRAAAKNLGWVCVGTDVDDLNMISKELKNKREISFDCRKRLSAKAFGHTAKYDSVIYNYFESENLPDDLILPYTKHSEMRYGENPHQKAAAYKKPGDQSNSILNAKIHQGKKLSYNNIMDADGALACLKEFKDPTCVIVKHANPCGVSSSDNLIDAYIKAFNADPISAFGGIVALNQKCTAKIAQEINKVFTEIVIAPSFENEALKIFKRKKNLRVLQTRDLKTRNLKLEVRNIDGGLLVQDVDIKTLKKADLDIVTDRKPSSGEVETALFTWKVLKHAKSNGILIAKEKTTVGLGAGQVSRVDAVHMALKKGKDRVDGGVLASDAFFPFRDSIDAIGKSGIKLVIQPGGSIKDNEVIDACNEYNISMVFTKTRCFKH